MDQNKYELKGAENNPAECWVAGNNEAFNGGGPTRV